MEELIKKMNKTLLAIVESREDLSDYLFHFTNGGKAKEILIKITKDKFLKDINNRGVICFTEAPLLSLTSMFKIFEKYRNPMYAPYGIAIKKDFIFGLGGRNVVYGLPNEKIYIDSCIKWRFEEYEPGKKDFTWLREWRVPVQSIHLTMDNCFVITKEKLDLQRLMFNQENIVDVEIDGCVSDGQFWGNATGVVERSFKGISMEDINELNALSKSDIEKIIKEQDGSDTEQIGLGGFLM